MKSRASIKSHPLHPILVSFPIAFLIGTFIFDAGSLLLGKTGWWTTGYYLNIAGIIGALAAAIPGLVDYLNTVPPGSSAKTRATRHMAVNLSAVVLFVLVLFLRPEAPEMAPAWLLVLEAAGLAFMTVGGWLGGTLVYRNQIGVDPRYAAAGKWKEAFLSGKSGEAILVAQENELQVNQMKLIHVNGKRIVLARTEEGYVAFQDRCTHKGGSLAGGAMICGTVQCPWHGSQFEVKTGAVKAGPAQQGILTYPVAQTTDGLRLILP
jgi:uncharacterized membrane protein/nitrite reductase/ring-hydroxylating ferredoxin subunit